MKKLLIFFTVLLFSLITSAQSPFVGLVATSIGEEATPTPPTGKAVLSGFVINNSTPSRVNFNSSASVTGMTKTGFAIYGKTISSVTIDQGGLSGYFTVSEAFTFWDNSTIRLGDLFATSNSQDTYLDNFSLQYIDNLIDEPSTTNVKYVSVSGSGTQSGDSEVNSMTLSAALTASASNTTYWVKSGDYGDNGGSGWEFSGGGGVSTPIKLIGYDNAIGDAVSYTFSDALSPSSNDLPMISTTTSTAPGLETIYDYIIVKNFIGDGWNQGTTNYGAFFFGESNYSVFDNIYAEDCTVGISGFNYDGINNRVVNSWVKNASNKGFFMSGMRHLIENVYAVSTTAINMDYYIALQGGDSIGGHIVKEATLRRFETDTHNGHGVDIKSATRPIEHVLVEDITMHNIWQGVTFRHDESSKNVARNITATASAKTEGNLVIFRDGANYNVIENSTAKSVLQGIRFSSNSGETGTDGTGGHYNRIINVVIDDAAINVRDEEIFGTNTVLPSTNNEFIHVTFTNSTGNTAFYDGTSTGFGSTNEFINCILDDTPSTILGTFSATFTNTLFNSTISSRGTGAITGVDPSLNATTYVPSATFTLIDKAPVFASKRDINGLERNATLTTVGAVLHANETP